MEIIWKVCWISCLLLFSSAQYRVTADGDQTSSPSSTNESSKEAEDDDKSHGDLDLETQDQVAILKQINRVNDDGSYTFGYEAADGSFKIETRDVNGNVKGMFGFINEEGELKRVSYSASNGTGFQSTGTLNIPPLMSDEEMDQSFGSQNNPNFYEEVIRSKEKKTEESSTKINLLESTTSGYDSSQEVSSPRLPIFIYGSSTARNEVTSSVRPVVIQHIPKVRPTPATSSTAPTESEEILRKYPEYTPTRTSSGNFITFTTDVTSTTSEAPVTEEEEENTRNPSVIQVIRPRTGPFKKVVVTKRPAVQSTTTPRTVTTTEYQSKDYLQKLKDKETSDGNGVRRQLGITSNYVTPTYPSLLTSGTEDSPDVYGSGQTSRPYPTNAYRSLFTQIPQHQRILQNSYIQNQNQYLAALGNPTSQPRTVVPPLVPPVVPQNTNTGRPYTGVPLTPVAPIAQDGNIPPRQNNYVPAPLPQPDPQGQRQFGIPPNFVRQQYMPTMPPIAPPYQQEQSYNPIYVPPGLIEHIIRMLLAAQMRQRQQAVSPFQQAVLATLGPGNVPPELLDNRYDPRYYQVPYPNYSQVPNPYSSMLPRPGYEPYPPPYYQPQSYLSDPRYSYNPMFAPVPYSRYQQRIPYEVDPGRSQSDDFVLRMLFGYPRLQPQIPLPPLQNPSNVVERSPVYQPGTRDSTTSSTTPATRVGQVRNVQILGQISEDSEGASNFEESTKSGE